MLYFILGLITLIIGGELLVVGARELAARLKVGKLTIGLTVVAFGTSAPEIFTSATAALKDQGAIAIGNIVGSNIFNTLCVMGIIGLIKPIATHAKLIKVDVPVMIGVSLLFWLIALSGSIGSVAGIILLLLIIIYTFLAVYLTRSKEKMPCKMALWMQLVWIAAGLIFLVFGADWTVEGAVAIAKRFSISSRVIALSLVAIGTSLPELTTSIMAVIHKEPDIAIGNIIGSNIFNILAVGGISAIIAPHKIIISNQMTTFDIPIMLAAAIATLPILFIAHKITRIEGALLLGSYLLYMFFLFHIV